MNKEFSEFKKFIKNKNVAVVGLGISNRPLMDFLIKLEANVTGFDKKDRSSLGKVIDELENKGINLVLGEDYLDGLTGYDVIFKTPSMRMDHPALIKAQNEGTYITSEMEQFIRYCPAKLFGVTGSDGKTTTTTLIYNMLKQEGYNVWVGGNIGRPLFQDIEEISKNDKVVLELSSFQLMTIKEPLEVALITNLSPNHLDMHKDMNEYIESKKNIFKFQRTKDLLVLNKDNDITNSMVNETKGNVVQFSIKDNLNSNAYFSNGTLYINNNKVCELKEIKLRGMHNVENLLAAFCCVSEDVSLESMRNIATSFTGVEHRMEFVKEINAVKYYNDSIASSPTRTLAGLKAFNKPVILIAGGYDKKISFKPLAEKGIKYIKTLILMGDTKEKIEQSFKDVLYKEKSNLTIISVKSLEDAIIKAKDIAVDGDIVTLSPACASFDMFPNFEARGNKFKEIVNNI